jgi:hypothetical protein
VISSPYVTEDDVRHYLLDIQARNNVLDLDVQISGPEIMSAMQSAAREFNGLQPYSIKYSASALPKENNMFLDAIAYFVYLQKLAYERERDVPYTAGGSVGVELGARRIKHFTEAMQIHMQRFQQTAIAYKRSINSNRGWGRIG